MFDNLFKFLFGAAVCSGVIIGGSVVIIIRYFKKYGLFKREQVLGENGSWRITWVNGRCVPVTRPIGLINNIQNHVDTWVDIILSASLMCVGFKSPSLAIPLSIAGLVISGYVRWVSGKPEHSWTKKVHDKVTVGWVFIKKHSLVVWDHLSLWYDDIRVEMEAQRAAQA